MSGIVIAFEWLCSLLFAAGLLLILIELRTRYDKTFLFSGMSIILLTLLAALDIFVFPAQTDEQRILYWTQVQHVLGLCIVTFLAWYLMVLTGNLNLTLLKSILVVSAAVAPAIFTEPMLRKSPEGPIAGILYSWVFIPYGVGAAAVLVGLLAHAWYRSAGATRKLLSIHLVGMAVLALCGVVDILIAATLGQQKFPIPSFIVLGLLAFASMVALVFAERFLMLINERNAAYTKLQSAYRDLERATGLRQLGESTAIASHEIKNYLSGLRGNADLLEQSQHLRRRERRLAKNLRIGADNLIRFTREALELSKVQVVRDKTPIDLAGLVRHCVFVHFRERRRSFKWEGNWERILYHGDWVKLEHVFINLFNNAFEAGAHQITLNSDRTEDIVLVEVEDDGRGVPDERDLRHLFTAFHSSKKSSGGTGLGLSITRAIVESHGGHISVYSLNQLHLDKKSIHGLCFAVTLPLFDGIKEGGNGNIVLVQDSLCDLEEVTRVLRNVNVYPHLVENLADVDDMLSDPEVVVLMDAVHLPHANSRKPKTRAQLRLLSSHNGITYAMGHDGNDTPLAFCEEYVITHVLA